MHIVIKNFGPINFADMEIKPLTVLVGPNASGKSYLLYLIWSLLSVEPNWNVLGTILQSKVENIVKNLTNRDVVCNELKSVIIDFLRRFEEIIIQNLEILLKDTFMISDVGELVREDQRECEIGISDLHGDYALKFVISKEGGARVHIYDNFLSKINKILDVDYRITGIRLIVTYFKIEGNQRLALDEITVPMDDIHESTASLASAIPVVLDGILGYCPYLPSTILPDGRAGILRVSEPLASSLLVTRWREAPLVNAVDKAFFKTIFTLTPRIKSTKIAEIADFIENKLQVRFVYRVEKPRMVIMDEMKKFEISLDKAPSGIRELAPLIYILRYELDSEYYLIIEEPEAHLHPNAQSIVTRALALLSKANVYVLFSTHSIHVIDELHALIRLSKLSPEDRAKIGYHTNEGLSPENVSIYMITREGNVEKINVTDEGIEETCLDKIHRELASKHMAIEELIGS